MSQIYSKQKSKMSWFDATGIASLAKNALKEAQKTIDKALDIKDDGNDDGHASDSKSSSSTSSLSTKSVEKYSPDSSEKIDSLNVIKQSMSNPILSSVATATSASNLWGSFTGSFFDADDGNNEKSKPAVTIAPTTRMVSSKTEEKLQNANMSGRTSSASESVELLSSPITPSSGLASPSGSEFRAGILVQKKAVKNTISLQNLFFLFHFRLSTILITVRYNSSIFP